MTITAWHELPVVGRTRRIFCGPTFVDIFGEKNHDLQGTKGPPRSLVGGRYMRGQNLLADIQFPCVNTSGVLDCLSDF